MRRGCDAAAHRCPHRTAAAASNLPVMQDARSTGTASRSRWWSPRPRSRRTTPHRWSASPTMREPAATSLRRREGRRRSRRRTSWASRPSSRSATPRRRWRMRRVRVDSIYRTPRHNHTAIELHAATVAWEGDDAVRPRRDADVASSPRHARAGLRSAGGQGPRAVAVRRRRLRRQGRCGTTRSWRSPRRSWRGGRCAWCCRARACSARPAAAP